jgi:hypothetical protein
MVDSRELLRVALWVDKMDSSLAGPKVPPTAGVLVGKSDRRKVANSVESSGLLSVETKDARTVACLGKRRAVSSAACSVGLTVAL